MEKVIPPTEPTTLKYLQDYKSSQFDDLGERYISELIFNARVNIETLEFMLREVREWLDNNTTHYLTAEQNAPVLASASKKIWYHATDDVDSYPFSDVVGEALNWQR